MNTMFLLMAQYEKAVIPLSEIADEFFSFSLKTAVCKHNCGELGLPLIRLGGSQKSPLMVRIQDLADYIDDQAKKAKVDVLKSRI